MRGCTIRCRVRVTCSIAAAFVRGGVHGEKEAAAATLPEDDFDEITAKWQEEEEERQAEEHRKSKEKRTAKETALPKDDFDEEDDPFGHGGSLDEY